jgi:uncharacterized protein (DUF1330 family)
MQGVRTFLGVVSVVAIVAAAFHLGRASAGAATGREAGSVQVEPGVDPACDSPVLMMVLGTIEDREPLRVYTEALSRLPTYPEQQGYYLMTRPLEIFEGEWPGDRLFVVAHFPCAAAARGFWFSEDYQGIRALRAGTGPISVSLHRLEEAPARVDGAAPRRLLAPRPAQENP